MSTFLPNIPNANDPLDFSQGQLKTNNQALDTIFGIDHYQFSDPDPEKGFHNRVTTPPVAAGVDANVTPGLVRLYASSLGNEGLLQYSKGPNATYPLTGAVPTPLTSLHSTGGGGNVANPIVIGPGGTSNVLDFTGINRAIFNMYAFDALVANIFNVQSCFWTGSGFLNLGPSNAAIAFIAAGNVLQLKNNQPVTTYSNVYWTLEFERIQ